MKFSLFLLLMLGAAAGLRAEDPVDPTSGGRISGPYLRPPLPPATLALDSAEMVPPVVSADPPAPKTAPTPAVTSSPATQNVTINLIALMVKRGLIDKADAADLVTQAENEAKETKAQQTAAAAPAEQTERDSNGLLNAPAGGGGEDSVNVAYVPDIVRNQIRDEVTADVMAQARADGLVTKSDVPDWIHRFRITGDIRTRYEGDFFPDGNAVGALDNFNAINTGAPFDINSNTRTANPPTYNVDQDRDRFRLRARIGADVDLGEGFTAGLRIATGQDNQPVSENQTVGLANGGQGGNFSKYAVWIDRAFIRYELGKSPAHDFSLSIGRFDNPFFNSTMLWADDLAFDGLMGQGKYQIIEGLTAFGVAGAFPIFNTDLNFGTNSSAAGNGYASEDKWLYAGQAGLTWSIDKDFTAKGAVGFFDFENIQGKVSDPISQDAFATMGTNVSGDTDDSRPSFAQHGNTYIALRDVVLDPALATAVPVYEYYGLASKFQEVALTGQLDYSHFDPLHITLLGEFVDNVGFDRGAIINSGPSILPGPRNNGIGDGFAGGNLGYNARLSVGTPALEKFGDWNTSVTYRYLESDAVVDGFNDADFGGYLAGTNLQGFILGANFALAHHIWAGAHFYSADSIVGPPLRVDTLQIDLNAKF